MNDDSHAFSATGHVMHGWKVRCYPKEHGCRCHALNKVASVHLLARLWHLRVFVLSWGIQLMRKFSGK